MDEDALRELVRQTAAGDENGFAALFEATVGRVYGVALRITRQAEAAEEVVCDVYFQVWQQAGRYRAERGSALGWLLTISRSRALDHLRRCDPSPRHPLPETLVDETGQYGQDPEDLLLALERRSWACQALNTLTSTQRRLVELVLFEDLTHRELAERLGMPLGTVKTHLRKAWRTLRAALSTDAGVSGGPWHEEE
jgi:RNA polymerase sigma-70 factor (ECF subfamily)